jgi:3alpha(or 20beta)-hydroxysteroid dehydrogenase
MGRLDGKVVIVTGGARGQGEAHARLCVEEGARVVFGDVLDGDGAKVAADLGSAARYMHLDVTSEADWAAAVAAAEEMGPVRGLINNAAIHWTRPIEYENAIGFERIWRVNLFGPFLGIKAVIEPMRRAGGGSIINISSTAGLTGLAYHGAYGSAKWGLRGLTRTAAVELGGDGIRVNSIHPGPINTAMMTRGRGVDEDIDFDERFKLLPARRCGEPREVAQLAVFLLSDDSSFITGTEHTIDGGSVTGPPIAYEWDPAIHDKGPK